MEEVLTEYGYAVVVAADGEEALSRFERAHFDLIISDFQMPRKDGIELLRWVREHYVHRDVPFLLRSGSLTYPKTGSPTLHEVCKELHAHFMPKSDIELTKAIKAAQRAALNMSE